MLPSSLVAFDCLGELLCLHVAAVLFSILFGMRKINIHLLVHVGLNSSVLVCLFSPYPFYSSVAAFELPSTIWIPKYGPYPLRPSECRLTLPYLQHLIFFCRWVVSLDWPLSWPFYWWALCCFCKLVALKLHRHIHYLFFLFCALFPSNLIAWHMRFSSPRAHAQLYERSLVSPQFI